MFQTTPNTGTKQHHRADDPERMPPPQGVPRTNSSPTGTGAIPYRNHGRQATYEKQRRGGRERFNGRPSGLRSSITLTHTGRRAARHQRTVRVRKKMDRGDMRFPHPFRKTPQFTLKIPHKEQLAWQLAAAKPEQRRQATTPTCIYPATR